tara:strand:- start:27054 stop:28262 length:1209 start_codon:yes stop_codon:yes gene_type:complete
LCNCEDLELVIPLGESPVSEKYLNKEDLSKAQETVPLDLYFCKDCFHVQLLAVVNPDFLWSDFTFKTSNNPSLVNHFRDIARRIIDVKNIKKNEFILDVGSNDGTLLKSFKELGHKNILGIDPADEIALEATKNGIPTINAFMNDTTSQKILQDFGKASVVTANNVYAHVDDLTGMTNSIKKVLDDEGIFVFEVSYLLDVVQKNLIGTIFHEHLCYHSVISLDIFLDRQGLELIKVERGPEQGGSIVCYAQFKNGSLKKDSSVEKLIHLEKEFRLNKASTIKEMFERLESVKDELNELINNLKKDDKTIAGFGAARAGTTLLSYFGIGKNLEFLVDDNETKHYKFSPGDKLEVLPTNEIYNKKPDYILILAWLFSDKIIEKHRKYNDQGGTFLTLFPGVNQI